MQALRRGWSRWRYLREVWANCGASGPTPSPAIPVKKKNMQIFSDLGVSLLMLVVDLMDIVGKWLVMVVGFCWISISNVLSDVFWSEEMLGGNNSLVHAVLWDGYLQLTIKKSCSPGSEDVLCTENHQSNCLPMLLKPDYKWLSHASLATALKSHICWNFVIFCPSKLLIFFTA